MMNIFSAILFSISSNLDNIVIGIAYGIKKIKISFLSNFLIAIITTFGTFISMYLGKIIINFFPITIANILGSGIILLLGFYFLIQSIINLSNKDIKSISLKNSDSMIIYAKDSDKNNSGHIEIKEAITVGLGLTFNNIGTGIAASAAGVNILETVIFTFIASMTLMTMGIFLGNKILGKLLGKFAPLISGIILIILGIIELI